MIFFLAVDQFLFFSDNLTWNNTGSRYFRMFEREPKVKPVHIQQSSFLKIHDLVQQDKDNQSNSPKGEKEFSTFVNAIQKTKNKKLADLQLPE